MEIMIEIPDEEYNKIKECNNTFLTKMELYVKNGIPLPKGHGRLIDATNLFKKLFISQKGEIVPNNDADNFEIKYGVHYVKMAIHEAPTIIEADKEDEK